jgi:KaiC/GvpD/RAD55 family RecA-like ATPase
MQCGRCGEDFSGGGKRDEENRSGGKGITERWGGDYTIEAISFGRVAAGTGVREISSAESARETKAPPSNAGKMETGDSSRVVDELKKKIEEMNRMVVNLTKSAQHKAENITEDSSGRIADPEKLKRRLLGRNDPEFMAMVNLHLARIAEIERSHHGGERSPAVRYLPFISQKMIRPGIADDSVVLFVGPAGTMKSTAAVTATLEIARMSSRPLLYVLLNDSSSRFLAKIIRAGILRSEEKRLIRIIDTREIRQNTSGWEGNWQRVLMEYMRSELGKQNYSAVILDNINSFVSMVTSEKPRKSVFDYFEWCRESGLICVAIREGSYASVLGERTAEAYLADGVVQFSSRQTEDGNTMPVFRVLKMRGSEIDTGYYAIQLSSGALKFVPAVAI